MLQELVASKKARARAGRVQATAVSTLAFIFNSSIVLTCMDFSLKVNMQAAIQCISGCIIHYE
jgi:hypothetical protein